MTTLTLRVELLEYWHAGSGRGRGPSLDAEVVRTDAGLPYLPGRTLRGLLREAVLQAEESALPEVPAGATDDLFGAPDRDGRLSVTDATLGEEMEAWAAGQEPEVAAALFDELAGTAMDPETGQVKDKTLRVIEVAVPVTLTACLGVSGDAPAARRWLEAALPFVRGLGTGRRRGLGRTRLSLQEGS